MDQRCIQIDYHLAHPVFLPRSHRHIAQRHKLIKPPLVDRRMALAAQLHEHREEIARQRHDRSRDDSFGGRYSAFADAKLLLIQRIAGGGNMAFDLGRAACIQHSHSPAAALFQIAECFFQRQRTGFGLVPQARDFLADQPQFFSDRPEGVGFPRIVQPGLLIIKPLPQIGNFAAQHRKRSRVQRDQIELYRQQRLGRKAAAVGAEIDVGKVIGVKAVIVQMQPAARQFD